MSRRGNVRGKAGLRVRMLGPLAAWQDGKPVSLPASRKARALLAYLALSPRPVSRAALCELLWEEGASDPRGELRWCLSRLRSAMGPRILAQDDALSLDLSGCSVDALEIERGVREGIAALDAERLDALASLFQDEFLQGLEVDDSPAFASWVASQRRRLGAQQAALLEALATRLPAPQAQPWLERWLQVAPFDRRVHQQVLHALADAGRIHEGEEHLAAAIARFEAEGLDPSPLREAWRSVRVSAGTQAPGPAEAQPAPARRASIAVMPFADDSGGARHRGGAADALAYDVTAGLARLRSLFVIAQGSTFALHERGVGTEEAARMLNVDYVLGGSVRVTGKKLRVAVELTETRSARVVWAEILNQALDDAFAVLEAISNRIVAAIAGEIETLERNRAILRPPSSLDAWEAHHRGLWHMYRFTRGENDRARHFFEQAIGLDPTFARAHAGLSFTHFQDAFQGWGQRDPAIERAYASAGQGLMVDDRDPAAHWAMGRALWLRGRNEQAVSELEHAVDLSPNFAQGHYALAFVQSQSGDADAAVERADCSRSLSPFDPLLFAMLGSRAMALARLGRFEEAAAWAVKAAARPNAHAHIYAIAAYCLALAGSLEEARAHAAAMRRLVPGYGVQHFIDTFRFEPAAEALFRKGAARIGM